ncbi:hypothetical protein NP233_g12790 [Leucocoprinus birnbaumii]|uniref:Protein kinase domain-containing protein n=1 Tax=Leucocoprinus birnbaumii TaxID=56174 RepID=A0AAD5YPP8_9AGAR|nr:hypothetical protein NP233_g12790 [Leucocoprinus birnbaumii]
MPTLTETCYTGAALDLFAWPRPTPPTETVVKYEVLPRPTLLRERYKQSIDERVALPSTPPTVSIILEERMVSSMKRVPHVWMARVQGSTTTYPSHLVAKIYDPVFFDDYETQWHDPFYLRDLSVSCEVEAYRRLEALQGTQVPRFYGYFTAMLPAQHSRTVYLILLERVPGRDLRAIVPQKDAEKVCLKHKEAIVDVALRLFYGFFTYGVRNRDMQPRNIILRPQKHASRMVSRTWFCDTEECPLVLEVDCDDLNMVMVDFERVNFGKPGPSSYKKAVQHMALDKQVYIEDWLENVVV